MPSTPSRKAVDLGPTLAKRKSQDFASKIQGWNQLGGGVAQGDHEVVVIATPAKDASRKSEVKKQQTKAAKENVVEVVVAEVGVNKAGATPVASKTSSPNAHTSTSPNAQMVSNSRTTREVDLERKAFVRRKSKPQNELPSEVKEATTPKKRVISDGHWRRDRLAKPEEQPTPEKDTTPKQVTVRRSVASVGLKVPPSVQDFVEVQEAPSVKVRPVLHVHSQPRSRSRERQAKPDYEDSGVRVFIKRRQPSKAFDSDTSLTAGSSYDRPSTSTDITAPSLTPPRKSLPRPATAPRESTRRRSAEEDDTPRKASRRKSQTPEHSRPTSRDKTTDVPPLLVPGSGRINGWLASVSDDPFVETIEVQKRSSRKALDSEYGDEDDSAMRKSGGRRAADLESLDTSYRDYQDDESMLSSPGLARRGARRVTHSPVKERDRHAGHDSRRIASSVDLRHQIPRKEVASRPTTGPGRPLSTIASVETLPTRVRRVPSDEHNHITVTYEESLLSRASDGDQPSQYDGGLRRRLTKHEDLMSVLSAPREQRRSIRRARTVRRSPAELAKLSVGTLMSEVTTDELKYQRELRTLLGGVIPVLLKHVLQKTDSAGVRRTFSGSSPDGQAATTPIVAMGVALERLKTIHKRIPMHDANELLLWADGASRAYSDYLRAWRLGFENIIVKLAPLNEDEPKVPGRFDAMSSEAERVDVAYLLKRPLVRIKDLANTLKDLGQIKRSTLATDVNRKYQDLVNDARRRVNEEKARLEDEAAAGIDPTRARDPRNLASITGVSIDPTRNVIARDYFDLDMVHSSGQQLVCKIEMIIRDDAPGRGTSGDILFCEVSDAGRWLLLPPIPQSCISARTGDQDGRMVLMVRGLSQGGAEWRELMALTADEDGTVDEWLDMLSESPVPPRLTRNSSFNTLRSQYTAGGKRIAPESIPRPPSPSEVDIPIGERATSRAQKWDGSDVNSVVSDYPPLSLNRSIGSRRHRSTPMSVVTDDSYEQAHARANRLAAQQRWDGPSETSHRPRPHFRSRSSYIPPPPSDWGTSSTVSTPKKDYSVWLPPTDHGSDESSGEEDDRPRVERPGLHRRKSSVPAHELPTVNKLRKSVDPETPPRGRDGYEDPMSAPAKLQKRRATEGVREPEKQASMPAQGGPTTLGLRKNILPSFTPAFLKKHRRSSSPLKHEYAPSSGSESLEDSDSYDSDGLESVTSESSASEEAVSTIGELKDFRAKAFSQPSTPRSRSVPGSDSLRPSESASQGPYRRVPPTTAQPSRTVAGVFQWAERGTWDSLHPEDCCIVVTPGLIEAFDMTQAHAACPGLSTGEGVSPSQSGIKPLVALELTPLVPLRRGTAVDISIRSPPTANSLIRTGNNIMFRSRSPEECEQLYSLINRARIDNPTYIALQNARGPAQTSNWGEIMDKRNAARTSSAPSWFRGSRKNSTYRSSGTRPASVAVTDSSIGTVNSAFSALRRFSGGNRIFNLAKSTLTSKEGTRSTYSDSLSSGIATPMPFDPSMGTPLGITNAKIRLYVRETMQKWRDMGSARLTILLPPRHDPIAAANPKATGLEKRIIICGKSKGEMLLDVTLGEQYFERIARTGIAISVWQELKNEDGLVGVVGAKGGVNAATSKVYMIQMKSERDAAYTFSLVGKLRY